MSGSCDRLFDVRWSFLTQTILASVMGGGGHFKRGMIMRRFVWIMAFVCALAGTARAEPGPIVNWLINEPASMLDIGMMRLESKLNKNINFFKSRVLSKEIKNDEILSSNVHVFYDWDENRIYAVYAIFATKDWSPVTVKSICDGVIDALNVSTVSASSYFKHIGYVNKSQPVNIEVEIDNITMLEFIINFRGKKTTCSSPVNETGYSIKVQ